MDERSLVPRAIVRTGAQARAGDAAVFASDEFFGARIRNPHTRRAYGRAVARFLAWVEDEGVDLARVTPGMAGRFLEHGDQFRAGRAEVRVEIANLDTRLSKEIAGLENRLIRWMVGTVIATATLTVGILRLLG